MKLEKKVRNWKREEIGKKKYEIGKSMKLKTSRKSKKKNDIERGRILEKSKKK